MGNSFRMQTAPTLYGENKTAVSEDLLEVGLLVAFGFIAFSFILIIPGIRGRERLFATCRVFIALWVGAVILVSNFGYGWYVGNVRAQTQYKAFTADKIVADVGLHVGLRGLNITLKGSPLDDNGDLKFETIDYNERFWWADPWAQGRLGFGRYAGRYNQEFRAAQYRGMPYPILWVAEYFTLDGEQIIWGRKFRVAGWYTHILLWTAFALYLLDIIIFVWNIRYGTLYMMVTGLVMLLAVFSYGILVFNKPPIRIPWNRPAIDFTGESTDCQVNSSTNEWCSVAMEPTYGWSFYLTLVTGLLVAVGGGVLYVIDYFLPRISAALFHHTYTEDDELFFEEQPKEETVTVPEEGPRILRGQESHYSRTARGDTRGLAKYRQTNRRPRLPTVTQSTEVGGQTVPGWYRKKQVDVPLQEIKTAIN